MKKKMIKRLIGVLVLVFVLFSTLEVNATETKPCPTSNDFLAMFGMRLEPAGEGEGMYLYFVPEEPETNCAYKFRISEKYGKVIDDKFDFSKVEIGCGENNSAAKFFLPIVPDTESPDVLSYGVKVVLKAKQKIPVGDNDCNAKITIVYSEDGAGDDGHDVELADESLSTPGTGTEIECDNYANKYSRNSFNYEFCRVKQGAKNSGNVFTDIKSSYKGSTPQFSCSSNINDVISSSTNLTGENYFTEKNKGYLFGQSAGETITTKYYYHFAPKDNNNSGYTVSKEVSCTVKCQEAVEVEYGPPVASKAGLCFEYKVRVTSRVSCYSDDSPEQPQKYTKYCTPKPSCIHGDKELTQAGPNDAFNSCIKRCDGGKYTKKCSNKCFVEVYGSIAAGAKANNLINDVSASLLSNDHPTCTEGCENSTGVWGDTYDKNITSFANAKTDASCRGYYTRSGKKATPVWIIDGNYTAGRWYCEHSGNLYSTTPPAWRPLYDLNRYYTSSPDGFFRYIKYDGSACTDNCSWKTLISGSCGYDSYINQYVPCSLKPDYANSGLCGQGGAPEGYIDILKYDYQKNVNRYNKLINACKARATCSTTVSTYTISATYGQKNTTEKTTVEFPYSSKDYAEFDKSSGKSSNSSNIFGSTLFIDFPKKNEGLSGCYNNNGNDQYTLNPADGNEAAHMTDLYRTTWGFPGTWINLKTGLVSYSGSFEGSGWKLYKGKFCLPLNASNVNEEWYDAYLAKELGKNSGTVWSNTDRKLSYKFSEISSKCINYNSININFSEPDQSSIDYNIVAKARNFGYFKWDINISCFYALHDLPFSNTITIDKKIKKECVPDHENYEVRPSDPINLFPSTDGKDITDVSKSGRTPGFNWSEYAVNYKNDDYISDPPKLMTMIQTIAKQGKTYSDEYLDYQFYLSPSNLRKIRKDSKNYVPFDDNGYDNELNLSKGMPVYISKYIRDDKYFSEHIVPNKNVIVCNNIDKSSGGCLKLN